MKHCGNRQCAYFESNGAFAEYRDDIESCSDCGGALVGGEAPSVEVGFRPLVSIYRAENAIQAHLIKAILEDEEIPVEIKGESLNSALGELPVTVIEVEVLVPPEHRERARELALQFERERGEDSGDGS